MATVSDCRVSQVVNIKKGIHCLNPKDVRGDREDMERPTKETQRYYVTHVRDADLNKAMDDASHGDDQVPREEQEGPAPRCLRRSPAWRWIAASAPSPTPRRTSTA